MGSCMCFYTLALESVKNYKSRDSSFLFFLALNFLTRKSVHRSVLQIICEAETAEISIYEDVNRQESNAGRQTHGDE